MKAKLIITMILLSTLGWAADGKFQVSLTGYYLVPADANYKNIYGNDVLSPELQVGYRFSENWYGFAGYGFFSKSGETPILKEPTKSRQSFISLGAGYMGKFSEKFGYFTQAGACMFHYQEEALGETIKDSTVGFRLGGGIRYHLTQKLFLQGTLGYLYGSDTVNETKIKLGGLQAGIGIGLTI